MKLIILFLTCTAFFLLSCKHSETLHKQDFISNKKTAIIVGEAILESVYGEDANSYRPYKAFLMDSSTWIVGGTLPNNLLGGVPYIKIRKSDCKIIEIGHWK